MTTHTPEKLRELLRRIEGRAITVSERAELFGIIHDYANLIERGMRDEVLVGCLVVPERISEIDADLIGMPIRMYERAVKTASNLARPVPFTHPPAQPAHPGKCCANSGTFACECDTFQPTADEVVSLRVAAEEALVLLELLDPRHGMTTQLREALATQPAQSANAEKVHEVIEILRSGGLTSDPELADKLEAAIKGGA